MKLGMGVLALAGLAGLVQPAPQGPVGYWRLDETAGPSANAAGAYGAGTWTGATFSNAPTTANSYANTGCLSFDGVDDHVEIANSPELENVQEGDYTLTAWVRPADVPADGTNEGRYGILYKTGWHGGLGYTRDGNGEGRFIFEHWLTGNTWNGAVSGVASAPAAWYHVAGVVDRAGGASRIYVNGVERGAGTWAAGTEARDYGTGPWRIGIASLAAYGSYRWAYKGLIDDVRIYRRALSPTELQILALGVPAPANLQAQGQIQQVHLTWDPPANPPGYTGYTYTIFQTFNGTTTQIASGVTDTYYTDPTATSTGQGETYTYEVVAVSAAESGPSNSASAVPILPIPRTNDHDEGLFDDKCACGSSIPGALPGAAAWALLALAAWRGRRR